MDITNIRGRDGRPWSRFVALALAATVVASMLAVVPATTVAQEDSQTFIVKQEDKCIQVTSLGDGSQTVEEFYDYRSPVMDQQGLYSSYGTTEIQQSQVSQIFIYHGSEGLSLVFLHDKLGDQSGGFVATADISGLPSAGEWVVEDDTYNNRDDVFRYSDGSAHIVWGSNGNRTDGAAFRGLRSPNYTTITVNMQFNEQSSNYPYPEWDGSPEANEIEHWIVRSDTGETTELDMSQPIKISPGTCSEGISTFTPVPTDTGNTTTSATGTPGATTTTTTTVPTAVPMTTPTPSPTATQTATPTATPTTTASSSATQTTTAVSGNETTGTTDTGGQAGTTQSGGDGGGSGAFGPGFGVGLALIAVLALAVLALARRNG